MISYHMMLYDIIPYHTISYHIIHTIIPYIPTIILSSYHPNINYHTRTSDSFFFFSRTLLLSSFWQAVVTGVIPSPRFLPSFLIAHRVQQSHCSSIFYLVLLTHALALSGSQFVRNKKSPRFTRVCTRGDSNSRN